MPWNQYKNFSSEYLDKHHDLVLYDVFHHIKALLLFPPNCACKDFCQCNDIRARVVLSLNTDLYNKAHKEKEDLDLLHAMKSLLRIPNDHCFREYQADAYPLWLVEQELKKRDAENHFKIVDRLVWALLRLGKSYEVFFGSPEASLNEAIDMILGNNPLKTKVIDLQNADYLCGEKGYAACFKKYKAVCHFIVAFEYIKKKAGQENISFFSLSVPDEIEHFLSLSHWFQKTLSVLETQNVKENIFFPRGTLLPLPNWVTSDEVDILLEPYQDIIQRIRAQADDPNNWIIPGEKKKTSAKLTADAC
ncbi:MAG: hypothetical protein ACD_16C00183G0002 [uncultured bacterium]|nr:MAG: hypothetical protein ACD_16C00183G0002 [uncultured bacterium]HBG35054.1 hypothetical protein [Holosporales bacterium]HBW25043.1 hypothetical protein [Holosporales bacterium]HCC25460.1 hypothetical protein [Holosporales bacterium]HCE95179.1 hypothetical protein [Holosporales bacterium]